MAEQGIRTGGPSGGPALDERLEAAPWFDAVSTARELVLLIARALKLAVLHPTEWIKPAIEEASVYFRRTLVPLFISNGIWLGGFGIILFGALTFDLGVADRQPAGVFVGFVREVSTWITMMILAGVAGSALAADLGARKIRDELDALEVLGVDKFRVLIVPRVMAMIFVAITLPLINHLETMVVEYLFVPGHLHTSRGAFRESVYLHIYPLDFYASMVKHAIMGVFIAAVACQKGLATKGGAEGVGRAVNQTVVLSFLGIWIINSVFNTAFLTAFPQVSVLKG